MKRLILMALILCATTSFAQKVKIATDKIDKFENIRVVETEWKRISGKGDKWAYARVTGNEKFSFLNIKVMLPAIYTIDKGMEVILLDSDGNKHILNSTSTTVATIGGGSVGVMGSNAYGVSVIYAGDLSFLADHTVTDIRIQFKEVHWDLTFNEKEQKTLSALYTTFRNYLSK